MLPQVPFRLYSAQHLQKTQVHLSRVYNIFTLKLKISAYHVGT